MTDKEVLLLICNGTYAELIMTQNLWLARAQWQVLAACFRLFPFPWQFRNTLSWWVSILYK